MAGAGAGVGAHGLGTAADFYFTRSVRTPMHEAIVEDEVRDTERRHADPRTEEDLAQHPSLGFTRLDRKSLYLISWFGPRGLSSLLLILVPVFAGVPGGEDLFAICSLVVLTSVVLHGASPALLQRGNQDTSTQLRITVEELQQLRQMQRPHYILDVRTEDSFASDPRVPEGVLRVNPKYVVAEVKRMGLPKDAYLALYCT